MNSTLIAIISFACIFGGTLLGLACHRFLPEHHLNADSKDAVKVGAGMISMMSALVIGLLVSSAKQHFDSATDAVVQGGAKVILLDRALAGYGPEAREVRQQLRLSVEAGIAMLWPEEGGGPSMGRFENHAAMEGLIQKLRALNPQTDLQRAIRERALEICNEVLLTRWLQISQAQTSLPATFVVILLFWLTMLYIAFGLLAPHNWTVITVMGVGAMSLATALFLILEMNRPMDGMIKVSKAPLAKALELIGR